MFENDFLSDLAELQDGVNSGVIVAYVSWTKMSGVCKFKDFNVFEKNGKRSFQIILENDEGISKFFLRIPNASDKNAVKAYAWEDLFNVFFGAANMDKKASIKDVYEHLENVLNKKDHIICEYVSYKETYTDNNSMVKEATKLKSLKYKGISEKEREGARPLSIQENNEFSNDVPF